LRGKPGSTAGRFQGIPVVSQRIREKRFLCRSVVSTWGTPFGGVGRGSSALPQPQFRRKKVWSPVYFARGHCTLVSRTERFKGQKLWGGHNISCLRMVGRGAEGDIPAVQRAAARGARTPRREMKEDRGFSRPPGKAGPARHVLGLGCPLQVSVARSSRGEGERGDESTSGQGRGPVRDSCGVLAARWNEGGGSTLAPAGGAICCRRINKGVG